MRHALFLLLALALASSPANAGPLSPRCATDPALLVPDEPAQHFLDALKPGHVVNILAIGSATTAGDAKSDHATFPDYLMAALHQAVPGTVFHLTLRGGRGMTAEDMLPLLQGALANRPTPLVLWQTGTVEAVRGMRPADMQDALADGIQAVAAQGGDVVLIDPQFSRFLRANVDLVPYEDVLTEAAALPEVSLFPRFTLMRDWAENGRIDLERTPRRTRLAALETLNACLGQALAHFVLSGSPEEAAISQDLPTIPPR